MTQNQESDSTQAANPTRLRVSRKQTINLGDFNSITIEVSLDEDLPAGKKKSEQLDAMYAQCKVYIRKKLMEEGILVDD
jgi:hypothetical protein